MYFIRILTGKLATECADRYEIYKYKKTVYLKWFYAWHVLPDNGTAMPKPVTVK